MNISDQGIIISLKTFQEESAIITVFTRENGICSGVVNKIKAPKNAHIYLPGNFIDFSWNARLSTHIGSVKCELIKAYGAKHMHNKVALYAMNSMLNLIQASLKPGEKYTALFEVLHEYIKKERFAFLEYIQTELFLLQEIGYSLDLFSCASTGATDNLIYVSPKSGKAVCKEAGEPYKHLMLSLPSFLHLEIPVSCHLQIRDAMNLTGYFFKRHVFNNGKDILAREMFQNLLTTLPT